MKQIIRSSTSVALNYGEVQAAESKKDFIHKNSIILKELRETRICLLLLFNKKKTEYNVATLIDECDQLTAIFYKTINTVKQQIKK